MGQAELFQFAEFIILPSTAWWMVEIIFMFLLVWVGLAPLLSYFMANSDDP